MSININNLSEEELVDLNNRIVERLRFLHQARAARGASHRKPLFGGTRT